MRFQGNNPLLVFFCIYYAHRCGNAHLKHVTSKRLDSRGLKPTRAVHKQSPMASSHKYGCLSETAQRKADSVTWGSLLRLSKSPQELGQADQGERSTGAWVIFGQ